MDWFSWLSKTGLEQSLVYEYGLAFAQNELEEEDIPYFDHEFLQSMGISIAKHRLEILKLAKKEKRAGSSPHTAVSRVLIAIKRAKRCLSNYMRTWVRTEESSAALVVVPRPGYGSRWRGTMLKRNKKLIMAQQGSSRLLLTNGGSPVVIPGPTRLDSFSSPVMIYDVHKDHQEKKKVDGDDQGEDVDEYWTTAGVEEIRWDAMFQNLKPT